MLRKIIAILAGVLLESFAFAQQFPIQRLTVEEGLGHSIVYRTLQTQDGYIWFSTDNGLTRYDGKYFRNFTTEDGLPSNFIFDLVEWNNKLFICTFGGGIVTYESGSFKSLSDSLSNIPQHPIELAVFNDQLWIIDRFKMLYQLQGKTFKFIPAREINGENLLIGLEFYSFEAIDSLFLVASSKGLIVYDKQKFHHASEFSIPPGKVYNVSKLKNGNVLLMVEDELIEFNLQTNSHTVLFRNNNFSRHSLLLEDNESNIWVSTMDGELYFLQRNGNQTHTTKLLEGLVLNQLFEDQEHNVWLSTYGEGAWCIQSIHVRNFAIKGSIVTDMVFDHSTGNIIVTTINSGPKFFRQEENRHLGITHDKKLENFFRNKTMVVASLILPHGAKLLSSDNMLYHFHHGVIDSIKAPNPISALYYQKTKNRIWIGSRFSLSYSDDGLKSIQSVPGFDHKVIKCIAEDSNGKIFLGTDAGLYNETARGFLPVASDPRISQTYVNAIYADRRTGELWAGTNAGLAKMHKGQFELLDDPLTRVRCNSITGNEGRLWVGTVKGMLYSHKGKFEVLTTKDGIAQSNILKVIYEENVGILTLLSPNAISIIDVEKFFLHPEFRVPDLVIEELSSSGVRFTAGTNPLQFKTGMRELNMLLSTPLIKNRDKILYSYKINDRPWNDFNGREISLQSLPYGEIQVSVRAEKRNEPETAKIKTVHLILPKPFYLRWWFVLALIFMLIGLVLTGVWLYARRNNQKLLDENKRLDVEHKALRNLLNPHFLYNAINSIHAFILQNDQRQTLGYLSKFSQLVRLNLELLSTDRVPLDKELKNISLYLEFEKLRFADKLNYSIEIDPTIPPAETVIPSFIIQPFLENAIWHGLLPREHGGNLMLRINQEPGKLKIVIEDDGIGINTSRKHPKQDIDKKTSMGIHIIRERIELLKKFNQNYALTIIDKADSNLQATSTGTLINITVPVGSN